MSDGRLFTDYRPNGKIVQNQLSSYELKQQLQRDGDMYIRADRSTTVLSAGTIGSSVDTMVPELTKRTCQWNGCSSAPAQRVGIGEGRVYQTRAQTQSESASVSDGTFSSDPTHYFA
jgi:hypothetical protein